ncbi:hypothetical protein B0H14DRAFT_3702003 [Mycena olivaceomarginata]|nr:hypothetical protein B0H14DRAFT_3702003 [Mycena olivaceomarginata]
MTRYASSGGAGGRTVGAQGGEGTAPMREQIVKRCEDRAQWRINFYKRSFFGLNIQKWADVPPPLKKIAAQWFLIPQELEHDIFPSPLLSIAKLLEFPLPLESTAVAPQPAEYFSKSVPDITDDALILREDCQQASGEQLSMLARRSSQSVVHSHLGGGAVTRFPLWILTYWSSVHDIKHDAWVPWRNCQAWVNCQKKVGRKGPDRVALAEETSMMLAMVPWGRCKPVGLSDSEPFHTRWRFVGAHWLSGSQMNDMLELLRNKVNTIPESIQNTHIWGTALIPKILAAYRAADAGTYWTAPDLCWIRDLGKDVVQKSSGLDHLGTPRPYHRRAVLGGCCIRHDTAGGCGPLRRFFWWRDPEELAAACRWWLNQHTAEKLELADLPIARQEDGHPCGILVDDTQQHFVDPSVPLLGSAKFLDARLEVFNKLCVRALEQLELERALAIAQDEDSDGRSDQNTATHANDSDSDSDTPILLLHRTAKDAKFTFTSPISVTPSSPIPGSPARVTGSKRPKPSNTTTPRVIPTLLPPIRARKSTVYSNGRRMTSTFTRSTTVDVFGHREREDYGADSEEASGSEWGGCDAADTDDFSWGPEDDAPVPPESQISGDASASAHHAHTNRPSPRPVSPPVKSSKCVAAAKGKITGYWKVETAAEKAVRLEKDAREYAEHAERVRLREVEEKRKAILQARESGNERMQQHRNRVCEEKIAGGWIPGKNKRKRVELADHDEISTPDAELPEHSHPHRHLRRTIAMITSRVGENRSLRTRSVMPDTPTGSTLSGYKSAGQYRGGGQRTSDSCNDGIMEEFGAAANLLMAERPKQYARSK